MQPAVIYELPGRWWGRRERVLKNFTTEPRDSSWAQGQSAAGAQGRKDGLHLRGGALTSGAGVRGTCLARNPWRQQDGTSGYLGERDECCTTENVDRYSCPLQLSVNSISGCGEREMRGGKVDRPG